MRLFRYFLLVLAGLTAVSCSLTSNNGVPTQVPTAVIPLGPAGTNALGAPFQTVENPEAGLQIAHPQDWSSLIEETGTRLTPIPTNAPNAEPLLSTAVSLVNLPDADPAGSLVAVLESVITNPNLGPPGSITRVVEPTAVTINGSTAATAQIQIVPPDLTAVEGDPNLEGNAPLNASASLHLYFTLLRQDERTILFSGTTDTETADIYIPIFETIAGTIQITPIQTSE